MLGQIKQNGHGLITGDMVRQAMEDIKKAHQEPAPEPFVEFNLKQDFIVTIVMIVLGFAIGTMAIYSKNWNW